MSLEAILNEFAPEDIEKVSAGLQHTYVGGGISVKFLGIDYLLQCLEKHEVVVSTNQGHQAGKNFNLLTQP